MVRFDTSPENSSSPEMLSLLEEGVSAAITLDRQVDRVDRTHVFEYD